ncbi:RidA family protein [Limimaricola pyoseonensis]|uniref:Enamine deaminase RidA, house cleaning of reactive enamine intermediates, YjgF/YER057c/UK114 family n=1 Tax=Limimaricola pyoseonensis TaxID=521013 RepID=A0A1G7JKZ9_9RHOB|nr:RidA family protein [Limimaricola pyoseonensis]SDF25591.1 Enamine deaminase RidA, house cleaning of reactive enamine intermediates, YjgF/YER057c/UK114 family [Limimaricola pyoseonensis]
MTGTLRKIGGSSRFSAIAVHNGQVHLAGQVSQLKDGDIAVQSRDVLAKVDALLAEAGCGRDDLISVQIWLSDMADYAGMNAVWDEWVSSVTPPTRVCVEARMAQPHYRIEVLAIAAER